MYAFCYLNVPAWLNCFRTTCLEDSAQGSATNLCPDALEKVWWLAMIMICACNLVQAECVAPTKVKQIVLRAGLQQC